MTAFRAGSRRRRRSPPLPGHATTSGYHCEQFLHGPWAAVDRADAAVVVAVPRPSRERCLAAARAAGAAGATVVVLAPRDDREAAALATEHIALSAGPELLSPIVAVVPLQLLTYHLALHRGVDPDTMRLHEPARREVLATLGLCGPATVRRARAIAGGGRISRWPTGRRPGPGCGG